MFLHGRANELWMQVLEKAYAKSLGGYWNISQRTLEEIMYDLTGCPIDIIHLAVMFIIKYLSKN
jgi:Calpain family cysteine protease